MPQCIACSRSPHNVLPSPSYYTKLPLDLTEYMWWYQVEIEHYSIAYFERVTAFEAL